MVIDVRGLGEEPVPQIVEVLFAVRVDQALDTDGILPLLPCLEGGKYTALGLDRRRNSEVRGSKESCRDGCEAHGDDGIDVGL